MSFAQETMFALGVAAAAALLLSPQDMFVLVVAVSIVSLLSITAFLDGGAASSARLNSHLI